MPSRFHRREAEQREVQQREVQRREAERREAERREGELRREAAARKQREAAKAAAADAAAAQYKKGQDLNEKADFAGARDAFDEAYRRWPPDGDFAQQSANCLLSAGNMALKANDLSGAKARYDELLGLKSLDTTLRTKVIEKAAAVAEAMKKAAAEKAAAEKAAAEKATAELKHWKTELNKMANARAQLCKEQARVRLAAAAAADEDESLRDATKARNAARVALVHAFDDAIRVHDEHRAEEQRRSLSMEAAALQQQQGARKLTLAEQVRLECLHSQVLPVLDEWVAQIGRVREEREDLGRHVSGKPPSLENLHEKHEAFKKAKRNLREKTNKLEDAKDGGVDLAPAQAALKDARRAVQAAEKALHQVRFEAAMLASAHFPELLAREPLLRVGKVDGLNEDEVRAVLVERELAHYELGDRLSDKDARHEVLRASYDGEACVLKEYKLDSRDDWKALVKEVTILRRVASCPFVANVQAVFETQDLKAAYVQLPYYDGGDMLQWLTMPKTAPVVRQRKVLLGQLCEALRHVHSLGYAHGDVKLENTLVSLEGKRATAHLADFESTRRQRTTATRSSLGASTGGGIAFTELYVAPEILKASRDGRERDAKPTAMGDMFSYGVCCLFACCLPSNHKAQQQQAIHRFAQDGRKLSAWSRDAAKKADVHLPDLLESLLANAETNSEAISVRLSARQTLLHPFHDTEAAQMASEAATAAARAAEAAVALRQREAEAEAQQRRRQLEEQEEALKEARKEADKETQRKAADLRTREKALEDKKKAITAQEKAAARMEKEAAQMKDAAEAAKIAAKEAAAKERAKVAAAQQALATEQAELQREKAKMDQKQAKLQVDAEKVNSEKRSLEAMIKAQHSWTSSPPMIYLSSSGRPENLPDLNHAIEAYLHGKVVDGGKVTIIELNDAKPETDPFADQPIYQTVKQHVKDLGYSTDAACYRFFKWQDVTGTELNNLLDKLARPGTICIVVGGNTWKLSYAFGQMKGVRATISRQVLCGDLMYVSFSAGSVMAGLTVEINMDNIDEVTKAGGTRTKDGFKLVQYAVRPHNQGPASQAAGKDFESRLAAKQVKDDAGQVIANCPVLYLKDGEACLFAGVAAEPIRLPDKCAKDKIAKLRYFLKKGSLSNATWSRPAQSIAVGVSKHEIKAHKLGSDHTKELFEFNFATAQYMRLLGMLAQQPTQVDVYESKPVQDAYEQLKAQFFARGFKGEIWVFHGTSSAATVQSICTGGFKVAGQPGGPPIANGAVYGHGIYAATGPRTPMSYGQSSRSVILCLALPGKSGRQEVDDSWSPKDDWVVFKTGAQLHPKYVVHF